MEIRLLGPLELVEGGRLIQCRGSRQRAVLALLALSADQVVPSARLLDELWGEQAPPSAANDLQQAISRLRRALPPGRLVTRAPGYVLRAASDEVDAGRFERLLAGGRQALSAGAAGEAARTLRQALDLWRGPALADFRYEPFAQAEIVRLEELRLVCLEERLQADLAGGGAAELVGELQRLAAEQPLRERPHGQLMLALYRAGRQAEALGVYQELRGRLVEELGLEPDPALRALQAAILRHDPALRVEPAPGPGPPAAARKPVTALCAELRVAPLPSAGRDPESLQAALVGALAVVAEALERHGGKLAAAAGDRALGVFGIPALHEDDALRAARAALACRGALEGEAAALERERGLLLTVRCGVATGEALVGDAALPGFVGDPAARAAALAGEARPGEILVDQETHLLAVAALEVEPTGPDRLRLHGVRLGVRPLPLRLDAPLAGRERELELLDAAFDRAARGAVPVLATVLGEPGVGKTRLAHELAGRLASRATVLTGRCLPYGEGITFWPLRELVRQAGAPRDSREELEELLRGEADAATAAERLAGALGDGALQAGSPAEIFWAARRLLEALARRRPLLVIVEDAHWAQPTFLDLVESVAAHTGAPLLLLCLARPELLEQRPAWGGDGGSAVTLTLELLTEDAAAALLDSLTATLPPLAVPARRRLLEAAGGNPLFLEQLVASLGDQRSPEDGPLLPPTVGTLLKARLERLGPAERELLERAAVVGRDFQLGAVAGLLPEQARARLPRHVDALVARGLLQRPPGGAAGGEDYRFRHVLIQRAAYSLMAKSVRAELHERFAGWLERHTGAPAGDVDEMLGYQLEQAAGYQRELAPAGARLHALARRAAGHLEAAGHHAHTRGDAPAAVSLLERAAAVLPPADPALARVLTALGAALTEAGELVQADATLAMAQRVARAAGGGLEAHARVQRLLLGLQMDLDRATAEAVRALPGVLEVFERDGDQLGLCRARRLQAAVHWNQAGSAAAEDAWRHAAVHARRAGDRQQLGEILGWLASAALWGPTPAAEGIRRCEAYLAEVGGHRTSEAVIMLHLAGLLAMRDRLTDGHDVLARGEAILDDLGATMTAAVTQPAAFVAMLSGEAAVAEGHLRLDYAHLERMGEKGHLAMTAALLAQAITAQGGERHDEAEHLVAVSQGAAGGQDVAAQIVAQGVLARITASRGRFDAAMSLAREAVALARRTDLLCQHGDALMDLAAVLDAAGQAPEARSATGQALLLYQRKGNLPAARKAQRHLERSAL